MSKLKHPIKKFINRSSIVEAVQYNGHNDLTIAFFAGEYASVCHIAGKDCLLIDTSEGRRFCLNPTDFLVKFQSGKMRVMNNVIFPHDYCQLYNDYDWS